MGFCHSGSETSRLASGSPSWESFSARRSIGSGVKKRSPHEHRGDRDGVLARPAVGRAARPDRLAVAPQPEAGALDRLVGDGRLLPAVRVLVLRGPAGPAAAERMVG